MNKSNLITAILGLNPDAETDDLKKADLERMYESLKENSDDDQEILDPTSTSIWVKPNGKEIEINNDPLNLDFAASLDWKPV